MLKMYSSRREGLDKSAIIKKLAKAKGYDRIAGFFRSSMLEIAGEELESISGKIRVVCNSDLNPQDVATAKAASLALRKSWCNSEPEIVNHYAQPRYKRLYELLSTKKLEVRVLPDECFGLIHGKAGVIELEDGSKTAFLGSANESFTAWRLNYELLWEADSLDVIKWVQEEFDALWNHQSAVDLSDFIVKDIKRVAERKEVDLDGWKDKEENIPASSVIETPVFRKEYGLWPHQKYFVEKAFNAHLNGGARFVLADQVGLGKTVQLAMSAMLMALHGDKPVLVLCPKPLVKQWQEELLDLLDFPVAYWDGKRWVDELGNAHPSEGPQSILSCPRKMGIVSQGLITSGTEVADILKLRTYECVIVDESHRARRSKINGDRSLCKTNDYNNLMKFLFEIADKTKSLLLATATPVQLHPIEAWDLLDVLATGNQQVFGNSSSQWRKPERAVPIAVGDETIDSENLSEAWKWVRNPFPPADEGKDFKALRRKLRVPDDNFVVSADKLNDIKGADITKLNKISKTFGTHHNPFIRHIIRRTRTFLENKIDPETNEPYLQKVEVKLFGEAENESIVMDGYLKDAYDAAEEFCSVLARRVSAAGFLKTLLLRRIGSSVYAGKRTCEKMLNEWSQGNYDDTQDDLNESEEEITEVSTLMKDLTKQEREILDKCKKALEINQDSDPKYEVVKNYLFKERWLRDSKGELIDRRWADLGCILFSQYYDTVWWLAGMLTNEISLHSTPIGIYAGAGKSGIMLAGDFKKYPRDELKKLIKAGELKIVLGTDAASEGLNLQRLGTLINLDLPWNPTRLEQRKGRIQRIGQSLEEVFVANLRYRGSVEDRVHQLLSNRLEEIFNLFGQIPDVLEDVWIRVVNHQIEEAEKLINSVDVKHPFNEKYNQVHDYDWESCSTVLNREDRINALKRGW